MVILCKKRYKKLVDKTKWTENYWLQALEWIFPDEDEKEEKKQRLLGLWNISQPLTDDELSLIRQIIDISHCNWNLKSILDSLIESIRKSTHSQLRIGHQYSITDERWKKGWAYYFALKKWLPRIGWTGISTMQTFCDPESVIDKHVQDLLGERTTLKELYVELFCHFFELQLLGLYPEDSITKDAVKTAKNLIIGEIKQLDYDETLLAAINLTYLNEDQDDRVAWFEVCHHKFFRRVDIILSSIGVNQWRGKMTVKGTDREELLVMIMKYNNILDTWLEDESEVKTVGKHTPTQVFQTTLLNSHLKNMIREVK